jgi:arsenate reductase-like glutaredoxin family protein
MKYVVMILSVLLIAGGGLGYWYYRDSQKIITTLTENNAELEISVQLNEQTIKQLEESYNEIELTLEAVNAENVEIRRRNSILEDTLDEHDIGLLAEARPELIERLINRGTENAFRCFELMSGAELTEQERSAENGEDFNSECPWLFDSLVRP